LEACADDCAAARLAADGDDAGSNPATSTACGVAPAEGSVGAADWATACALSSPFIHQAQREAVWQPEDPAVRMLAITNLEMA
jgi:hypothetical protein